LTTRLDIFLPSQLVGRGPSYTCAMIAQEMARPDGDCPAMDVNIVTPRAGAFPAAPFRVTETLPYWARPLPYRWSRPIALSAFDRAFLRAAGSGAAGHHAAYIWPNASLATLDELKRRGITVFREMINGPRWRAQRILDDAYKRLGLSPSHGLDEASSEEERQALNAVDYAFSPNTQVTASLLETGLPPHRILEASYGWDPKRFSGTARLLPPTDGVTILFVGTICVRKGAHLLLDYWARSKLRGRLIFAGEMEPAIKQACAGLLARDDVQVLDYVADAGALYRSADIFAFPTLEEGGPQVTYEACGCGLPVITSPMGAGRIAIDGKQGFIRDPYDGPGWIAALQTLAEDVPRRRAMALAARESAEAFHWEAVGIGRKRQVLDCLQSVPNIGHRNSTPSADRQVA
jgi:glycosyltransferase involved in cell wall biosynthesis